ncbi:PREDICTED: sorting nexin-24 [Myotis brandtii]|uniref:sorting nexin-24 n=1 Tax=Myotis brandtii TaxID=109478 RepID=UPI0003BC00DF|nr:PREDICTED: sorting nexin-24 [Myotis brandtii]
MNKLQCCFVMKVIPEYPSNETICHWFLCFGYLKKCIKTPEIPSKHVRNWVPKVLEQRRQGLETYLQAVILENEELPKLFLDFLNIRHLPSLPKAESCGSFEETESEESSKLSHQPVLLFLRDPYVLPAASDFPNVVIEGVLHGIFYPHLQPR